MEHKKTVKTFRDLIAWQKAMALAREVYRATAQMPDSEKFGLTTQMRRAAVSIPSNIAEGCGKDSDAELKRYFLISMGSASELEYLLILAHDLGYLTENAFQSMTNDLVEIRKMLNAFIQKLKASR